MNLGDFRESKCSLRHADVFERRSCGGGGGGGGQNKKVFKKKKFIKKNKKCDSFLFEALTKIL
jgi:hypothetical protein